VEGARLVDSLTPVRRPATVPAPLLVLGGVVSVQFGGALAATLVPEIGAAGSVTLRLWFATLILLVAARPVVTGHTPQAWRIAVAFGLALGLMNFAFYGSLAHLPLGVAVTIEFLGPLTLATVLSRRVRDLAAVVAAGGGVILISEALRVPLGDLDWTGLGLAATAGACWAAYIILSGRTGRAFAQLDGLAFAMVVATLVVLPFGIGGITAWTATAVVKGAGIAILSSVLPYSLELLALRRLRPAVFGILLSLEPAVAALAGLLVLGQRLRSAQLLGMLLVVAASALVLGGGGHRPDPADAGG
jgi:inner membrane transporter RhtA